MNDSSFFYFIATMLSRIIRQLMLVLVVVVPGVSSLSNQPASTPDHISHDSFFS